MNENETLQSGSSWDEMLKRYKIKNITEDKRDGWNVESNSGNTYHVRSVTVFHRDDGCLTFKMTCNCAAWKRCRHIDAVEQMRYAEDLVAAQDGDTDGMEILERTA